MPEFAPGEVKTARAPITVKPSGLSCSAELYLVSNGAKVTTSGIKPFTSTGARQDISFPITMPTEGRYPVWLDVFVQAMLIGAYKAVEDVSIVISKFVLEITDVKGVNVGESYYLFDVYCKISNPSGAPTSGWVRCYGQRMGDIGKTYERVWSGPYYPTKEYPLTLAPGETQTMISPAIARSSVNPSQASQNFPWKYYTYYEWDQTPAYFWLEDDKGNKSAVFTLTF
ncbi:hypothetical protein ES703_47255 [subsurface metagenome]